MQALGRCTRPHGNNDATDQPERTKGNVAYIIADTLSAARDFAAALGWADLTWRYVNFNDRETLLSVVRWSDKIEFATSGWVDSE